MDNIFDRLNTAEAVNCPSSLLLTVDCEPSTTASVVKATNCSTAVKTAIEEMCSRPTVSSAIVEHEEKKHSSFQQCSEAGFFCHQQRFCRKRRRLEADFQSLKEDSFLSYQWKQEKKKPNSLAHLTLLVGNPVTFLQKSTPFAEAAEPVSYEKQLARLKALKVKRSTNPNQLEIGLLATEVQVQLQTACTANEETAALTDIPPAPKRLRSQSCHSCCGDHSFECTVCCDFLEFQRKRILECEVGYEFFDVNAWLFSQEYQQTEQQETDEVTPLVSSTKQGLRVLSFNHALEAVKTYCNNFDEALEAGKENEEKLLASKSAAKVSSAETAITTREERNEQTVQKENVASKESRMFQRKSANENAETSEIAIERSIPIRPPKTIPNSTSEIVEACHTEHLQLLKDISRRLSAYLYGNGTDGDGLPLLLYYKVGQRIRREEKLLNVRRREVAEQITRQSVLYRRLIQMSRPQVPKPPADVSAKRQLFAGQFTQNFSQPRKQKIVSVVAPIRRPPLTSVAQTSSATPKETVAPTAVQQPAAVAAVASVPRLVRVVHVRPQQQQQQKKMTAVRPSFYGAGRSTPAAASYQPMTSFRPCAVTRAQPTYRETSSTETLLHQRPMTLTRFPIWASAAVQYTNYTPQEQNRVQHFQ